MTKALDELERVEKIEMSFSMKSASFEDVNGDITLYLTRKSDNLN
jgi:hypothetical protein